VPEAPPFDPVAGQYSPQAQAESLIGPLRPGAQQLRDRLEAAQTPPLEQAAIKARADAANRVQAWFERNARYAAYGMGGEFAPGVADTFADAARTDPFPREDLRLMGPDKAAAAERYLHEAYSRPRVEAAAQLPEGWYVPEHLAATWRAEVPAAGKGFVAEALDSLSLGGGGGGGGGGRGGMPALPYAPGGFNRGAQALQQHVGEPLAGAVSGLRASANEDLAAAREIRQGLPQTAGAQLATGAADTAAQMGAGALASALTGNPAVGAAMFTGLFSTESAGRAYAEARGQGRPDRDALEDAAFAGVKAAIVSKLPMSWPALARETAATQMAGAFLSGTAITTGDAAADQAWRSAVRGEKFDAAAVQRIAEAFLQGGAPAALIHGAHELPGARLPKTPANAARTSEPPLARPDTTKTPAVPADAYAPGPRKETPGVGEFELQPTGTLRSVARSRGLDYRLPREQLIAELRKEGTPNAEEPSTITPSEGSEVGSAEKIAPRGPNAPESASPAEGAPDNSSVERAAQARAQAEADAKNSPPATPAAPAKTPREQYEAMTPEERRQAEVIFGPDWWKRDEAPAPHTAERDNPAKNSQPAPENEPTPPAAAVAAKTPEPLPTGERPQAPDRPAPDEGTPAAAAGEAGDNALTPSVKTNPPAAPEKPGIGADEIGATVGKMGGGVVDGMYDRLWADVTAGKVDPRTTRIADQVVARAYGEGRIRTRDEMAALAREAQGVADAAPEGQKGKAVGDWYRKKYSAAAAPARNPSGGKESKLNSLSPPAETSGTTESARPPEPPAQEVQRGEEGGQRDEQQQAGDQPRDEGVVAGGAHGAQSVPEAERFAPPAPESTDTIAAQKRALGEQLRHAVATSAEYHDDLLHRRAATDPGESNRRRAFAKSATVGQRVAQGSLEPKALVDLPNARRLARQLPPEHPAHRLLRKLEALEDSPQKRGVPTEPPTSLKNEVTARERAKREMPEAEAAARRGFGDVWEQAGRDLRENPDLADHLVETLRDAPRALTDHEDALLLHRQIELQNQYRDLTDRVIKSHGGDPAETAELNARLAGVSDKLLELYDVGKAAGTETGRGLNARKIMARRDYSLAAMETAKRAANRGRPLTPEEHARVRELHEKVARTQKAFDDYVEKAEARNAELQSRIAHERLRRQVAAAEATPAPAASAAPEAAPRRRLVAAALDRVIKAGDAAGERLRAKFGSGSRLNDVTSVVEALPDVTVWATGQLAKLTRETGKRASELFEELRRRAVELVGEGIAPHFRKVFDDAVLAHEAAAGDRRARILGGIKGRAAEGETSGPGLGRYVQALARELVAGGVTDREKLIDAVHAEVAKVLPDFTRRQAMDAISGYGEFKQLSKDQVSATLRDLKGQMQQIAKLQDMTEKGRAPLKTGVERRTPSDEERRLLKEVNETKKRLNIQAADPETQLKGALDAVKTRLRNQVKDLEYQVATGQKLERARTPGPRDAESAGLEARRDELRRQYDSIFGKPELTDEQRLKLATAAVERSVADYDRRLADARAGRVDPATGRKERPTSPELEALRARRDAMREELAGLRDADAALAERRQLKALEASLAEYERRVKETDVAPRGKRQTADTQPVAELRARRDAARKQLDALRKAARPPGPTAEEAALRAYKTRTAHAIADLAERIAREDYAPAPPREALRLDEEGLRLRAEHERMKQEFQRDLLRDRLKRRTVAERVQDTFVQWRRGFVLSSPVTLAKLTSAALERTAFTPLEEGVGAVLSRAFPGLAARAPREGGFSGRAEARAITEGFTAGMRDAWEILRTGKSSLDRVHGHGEDLLPRPAIEFIGSVHGALKSTTKRNEFARSFQKRVEHAIRNGLDPTDPAVQVRIAKDAYVDASRSIFQSSNVVVEAYRRWLGALKRVDKATGRARPGAKALATVAETLIPIVKVPTNVVAETFQYALGIVPGAAKLAGAYARGIKSLPEHEADAIMRQLKKGSIGAAVMALGYFGADQVGGYYQHGEKRDEGDVPLGGVRVFGHDVPRYLVHNPLLECLQVGATIRRVSEAKHKKSDPETKGLSAGATAAALGLVEEVPFVRTAVDLGRAAVDERARDQIVGRTVQSIVVPAAAEFAARHLDDKDAKGNPVKRDPKGILQNVEMGIPGLRKNVPLKEEKPAPDPRVQAKEAADREIRESLPKEVRDLAAEHARLSRIPAAQRTRDERVRLYRLGRDFQGDYEAGLKRLRLARERGDKALEQRTREAMLASAKSFQPKGR
jgi:hypothetical protein